jgi:TP901 family phage tail tape measure protein
MANAASTSNLKVILGGDTSEAQKSIVDLEKKLKELRSSLSQGIQIPDLKLIKTQVEAGLKPLTDLRQALRETIGQLTLSNNVDFNPIKAQKIAEATLELNKLEAAEKSAIQTAKQNTQANFIQTLELQAKAGIIPLTQLRDGIVKVTREMIAAKGNRADFINDADILRNIATINQLKKQIDGVPVSVETLGSKLSKLGSSLQQAFLPLAGVTAGLGLALQQFSSKAQDFETQLRQISTISKQSGPELQQLGAQIQKASAELQADPVELAAAQYEILSSGITNASEAFDVMEQSAKLAKAGIGTASEAADILTSSLNALGGTPARNAEILFRTVDLGKVKLGELAEEFGGVASQAAVSGVSLEEISASVATLSLTGKKAAEGLTGIRSILTAVSKQAPEAVKYAKQLGIEFNTAAIRAKGFSGFIADIQTKTKGSDEAIAKLFGRVEGINTVLALGGVQAKQYAEILDKVKNSSGQLDDAFQRTLNPISGFTTALQNLSITAGETLNTSLAKPLQALTGFLNTLRDNRDLVAFGIGATVVAAALGGLATAASLAAGVIAGLIPAVEALAVAMGIGVAAGGIALGPAILTVVGAIAALAATGGAIAVWANKTTVASRSIQQLDAEVEHASASITTQAKATLIAAQNFDTLSKKTNKTTQEKAALSKTLDDLVKKFPTLKSKIDEISNGYTSLTAEIQKAIKAQITLAEGAEIDKQLAKVQAAIQLQGVQRQFTPLTDPRDETKHQKDLNALISQRNALLDRQKNLQKSADDRIQALLAPDKTNSPGNAPVTPDTAAANARLKAAEELAKEIRKIEADLTGFEKGEFAKRRAEAEKTYQDEIAKINDLAKRSGKTGTDEVVQAKAEALRLRELNLAQISQSEQRAKQDSTDFVNQLRTQIKTLRAEISEGNPFDDLAAQLLQAKGTASKAYTDTLRQITDNRKNASQDSATQSAFDDQARFAKVRYDLQLQQADQVFQTQIRNQKRALDEQVNQNKIAQADISGDTLKAIAATRDAQLAANQALLDDQKRYLAEAQAALAKHPDDAVQQLAQQKALGEIQKYELEAQRIQQDAAQKSADVQVAAVQPVISFLQKQIELQGQSPELVAKLQAAYAELITQLQAAKDLTGQTADKQSQLTAEIQSTTEAQAQLSGQTSIVGKALAGLKNLNFGTGQAGNIFSGLINGLDKLHDSFTKFKSATDDKGNPLNAGKSLLDFFKQNSSGLAQGFAIGANLVQGIGQAISSKSSGLKKALTNAISGALSGALSGAATGNPIAAAVGGIFGLVSGAASSGSGFQLSSGLTGLAIAGPIGFLVGGLLGAAKQAKKAQEQLAKTQKFVQQTLATVDQSDINSLSTALVQILNYKSGGGQAFAAKKQAADQLREAIQQRQQTIDQAIRDFTLQNTALSKQFTELDSTPIANLTTEFQVSLDALVADRDKALDQYKDSVDAQNLINQNFVLKQQALIKQSSLDEIDAIIEAENRLREYQAQTALSNAQASGNQIAIINANLQTQLVAIDNEIASFKGSEEEKTEFLKQELAKRNAAIADANN